LLEQTGNARSPSSSSRYGRRLNGPNRIIPSKLRRPRERSEQILRTRLLSKLDEGASKKLVLVSAPAGYGKTTLLSQWVQHREIPTAWVSLEESEGDVNTFWSYVIASIEGPRPGAGDAAGLALVKGASLETALLALLESLGDRDGELALVLDDFQEASSPSVDDSLAFIVAHSPPSFQIILSTRTDPVIPLSRWRVSGEVLEIRQDDLRFSVDEAESWLRDRMGLELTRDTTRLLVEKTEGWSTALYLSALAMRSGESSVADEVDPTSRPRMITEYVTQETVKPWPSETRLFMQRLSPLSSFSGGLVDYVFEIDGSEMRLEQLERSNLMLSAIVGEPGWYRMHSLLAEVLRSQLRAEEPGVERKILRGASRWFADRHENESAINYALEGEDFDMAANLVNEAFRALTHDGGSALVRGFLDRFPEETAAQDVRLLVTKAWTAALYGQWPLVESSLDAALARDRNAPLPDGMPSVEAAAASLRSVFPHNGTVAMRRNAGLAMRLIPEAHPFRSYAELGLAAAADLEGNVDEASRRIRAALGHIQQPDVRAGAIAKLALYDVDAGDFEAAEAKLHAASSINDRDVGPESQLNALIATAWGELYLSKGREKDGLDYLERGAAFPMRWHHTAHLESIVRLARAKAAVGDEAEVDFLSVEARRICLGWGEAGNRYLEMLPRRGVRLADVKGPAGDRLTTAELRVLERLASTHLTKPEIAEELYLSLNTVKSHVRSIYVKLGVASREEAIRAAGIESRSRQLPQPGAFHPRRGTTEQGEKATL
jgi:LuxR family transcriptional regulator, maltose regulon positive regulatory protein